MPCEQRHSLRVTHSVAKRIFPVSNKVVLYFIVSVIGYEISELSKGTVKIWEHRNQKLVIM